MSGKVKPLTKAEWEVIRDSIGPPPTEGAKQLNATLDALFAYRERTRGMVGHDDEGRGYFSDDIAAELGLG